MRNSKNTMAQKERRNESSYMLHFVVSVSTALQVGKKKCCCGRKVETKNVWCLMYSHSSKQGERKGARKEVAMGRGACLLATLSKLKMRREGIQTKKNKKMKHLLTHDTATKRERKESEEIPQLSPNKQLDSFSIHAVGMIMQVCAV